MHDSPSRDFCSYTLHPKTALPRVFNLYRTMGLRHIPIVVSDFSLLLWAGAESERSSGQELTLYVCLRRTRTTSVWASSRARN